ncbi:MAG: hypothetical protein AB7T49_06805 [Oligoflexales bacterium]
MKKLSILIGLLVSGASYAAPIPADLNCEELGLSKLKKIEIKHIDEEQATVTIHGPRLHLELPTTYSIIAQEFQQTDYMYVVPDSNEPDLLKVSVATFCNRAGCETTYLAFLSLESDIYTKFTCKVAKSN